MVEETPNRPDMVEAARKFMLTPKVRETPFEEQRQFLLGKGLTEAEISAARASLPSDTQSLPPGAISNAVYAASPQQNRVVSLAQSALVIGSVSYAGYRFLRSYVLPRFFDIPDPAQEEIRQLQTQVDELQNSIKFVMDSVSQTTQTLAKQQLEITSAFHSLKDRDLDLTRVEAGISTIKSLLLSHNNFAPIVTPSVTALPSWQNAGALTTSPPANANRSTSATSRDDEDEFVDTVTGNAVETTA